MWLCREMLFPEMLYREMVSAPCYIMCTIAALPLHNLLRTIPRALGDINRHRNMPGYRVIASFHHESVTIM
jgi:hypothetical protein